MDNIKTVLKPCYNDKKAICFACSNEYVKYLSVAILSLKSNTNQQENYDIIIFETDINDANKLILEDSIKALNISVRFFKMPDIINFSGLHLYDNISFQTYFKIFASRYLYLYSKIIFLDTDIIINNDINKLLNIDLEDKTLGACLCTIWAGMITKNAEFYDYTKTFLGLKEPYKYFQAGVLLIDVEKFNKNQYENKLIEMIQNYKLKNVDQCALNFVCTGDVKFIDNSWNYETEQEVFKQFIPYLPNEYKELRESARKNLKIIHYAGPEKPWLYKDEDFADLWWKYAEESPFYDEILEKYHQFQIKHKKNLVKNIKKCKFKIKKYKILSSITISNKRNYYINKLNNNISMLQLYQDQLQNEV